MIRDKFRPKCASRLAKVTKLGGLGMWDTSDAPQPSYRTRLPSDTATLHFPFSSLKLREIDDSTIMEMLLDAGVDGNRI